MVRRELDRLSVPYVIFNQRHVDDYEFEYQVANGAIDGRLRLGEVSLPIAQITAVYCRLMDVDYLPELAGEIEDSPRRAYWRNIHAALDEWLEIMPGCVVNRSSAMASNFSKPFQAGVISRHGFMIPETLITNDPSQVESFIATHGRVIYKSISGVRSIVTEFSDLDRMRLELIRGCPVQFQERVDGIDVRVHVVGDALFATAVSSEATDYRYGSSTFGAEVTLEPIQIGTDLMDRCRMLTHALGLEVAGIDLRVAAGQAVYCFEVNPSPAFSYYESSTGQPIARALAEYMAASVGDEC